MCSAGAPEAYDSRCIYRALCLHLSEKSGRLQCRNSMAVARKAAVGLAMSMPAICNDNRQVGVHVCEGGHELVAEGKPVLTGRRAEAES